MSPLNSARLPAGWKTVELGQVAERCLGKMLDAQKNKGTPLAYLRNPNVRWFDVDTSDLRTMPFEDHELDRYGVADGDVLICEGGEAGRAAIWDGRLPEVKFQKAIHRVRTGPDLFNRFLVHKLKADYDSGRLADYYTGATIKHLTGQDLARYRFALPPIAEQRRIAEVLDRAEALRAQRRQALAQLDALAESIFLDMFGDPALNPKGFPTRSLASLVRAYDKINYGVVQPGDDLDEGVPLVRVGDLSDGRVRQTSLKRISASIEAAYKRSRLRGDEILVSCVGTVGLVATADESVKGFNIARAVARVPISDSVERSYVVAYLKTAHVQRYFVNELRTVSQPTLNIKQLEETLVVLPPLQLQRAFAGRTDKLARLKSTHATSATELDALFASLQHRAFRGEL